MSLNPILPTFTEVEILRVIQSVIIAKVGSILSVQMVYFHYTFEDLIKVNL